MATMTEDRDELIEQVITGLYDEIGLSDFAKELIKKALQKVWRDGYATAVTQYEEDEEENP